MIYNFATKLHEGQKHEKFLDSFCGRWFTIRAATREEQRRGIDRIFTRKKSSETHTVEYKADTTASRTGNAFVETISVDTANKPGWAYTSEADWLLYYLPEDGLIYFFEFSVFRKHLPRWAKQFPTRAIPNKGYKTHGLLVPLDEFEQHATKVVNL
jgi:hypothetical protein